MTILQNVIASILPAKQPVNTLPDFWTVFGSGVTVGSPTFAPAKHVHLPITGTDAVTGYSDSDLDTIYGASTVYEFWGIGDMVDAADMDADPEHLTYFDNTITTPAVPLVKGGRQLTNSCKVRVTGAPNPQTHLYIGVQSAAALADPVEAQYFEIDYILPTGLDLQAGDTGTGKFFTIFDIKSGAWYDAGAGAYKQSVGDMRLKVGLTGENGYNQWEVVVDNEANGRGTIPEVGATLTEFFNQTSDETVRLGIPTKVKIYFKLPADLTDFTTSRFKITVKVQGYDEFTLCDETGGSREYLGTTYPILAGNLGLPLTRLMIVANYTSAELPNPTIAESVQIYDQPSDDLLKELFPPIIRYGAVDISLAGGTTQPREGTDTLSIDFTKGTPTQVTIARNDNSEFAVWPGGNLSQYFTSVTGGLDFALSLAHMALGANTVQVITSYSDYQKAMDALSITIEAVVEVDPEEISVAMAGGLTQYQEGIDTLQITFVTGTPTAVNIARNAETTFAQWPTGNLRQYFTEVTGGLTFDLALAYLNLGNNSIGVTATYSDASTANDFLTLNIQEVVAPPPPTPEDPIPAFPGAQGYGAAAIGGRGGTVIKVTNLNDSGAGSFREALMTEVPRTIVFTVGGTIDLLSDITVTGVSRSYFTVAGQTAPGGGIQTRYGTINITEGVHDFVIRHIRHRRGWEDYTPNNGNHGPGLSIFSYGAPVYNGVVDHCSFAWAQDDTGAWNKAHDITYQWCIFSEAKNSYTGVSDLKGTNGKGAVMGAEPTEGANMYNMSFHHNFMAHNYMRNPLLTGNGPYEVVNNVVYNYGAFGMSLQNRGAGCKANIIGNYFKAGPDTNATRYAITVEAAITDTCYEQANSMMYVLDNISPQRTSGAQAQWDAIGYCGPTGTYCGEPATTAFQTLTPWSGSAYPITVAAAADVPALVLAGVGATVPARDSNDTRIVSEYYLGTGSIHTYNSWPTLAAGTAVTDADNDGMADSWETSEGVTDPNAVAANGYTNLENYLNSLA